MAKSKDRHKPVEGIDPLTPVKQGKYRNTAEMVRDLSGEKELAERSVRRMNERAILDFLMAQRTVKDLSQKDIAGKMNCTQSRVSKVEAGADADLRVGDLDAYAAALGMDITILFAKKGKTIVDQIKYHVLTARRLLLRIAELSKGDVAMTDKAQSFLHEVMLNSAASVMEATRQLEAAVKTDVLPVLPHDPPPAVQLEEDEDDCPPRPTPAGRRQLVPA